MKQPLQMLSRLLRSSKISQLAPFASAVVLIGCAATAPDSVSFKDSQNATAMSESSKIQQIYQLGRAEFERGEFDLAMIQFKKVLKLNPLSMDARNGVAVVLFEQGRYDEAYEAIQVAARMSPDDLVVARNLAKISKLANASGLDRRLAVSNDLVTEVAALDRPPSVVYLGEVQGLKAETDRSERRRIDVTPMSLPQGFERILPTSQLSQIAPNVYQLSLIAPVTTPKPAQPPRPEVAILPRVHISTKTDVARKIKPAPTVRLSVANGNGKKGLACGQASILSGVGAGATVIQASCTDYKNFNQQETVLYLRDGVSLDAKVLASNMGSRQVYKVVRISTKSKGYLPTGTDAQLVIGKDWTLTNPPINNKRLPSTSPRIIAS